MPLQMTFFYRVVANLFDCVIMKSKTQDKTVKSRSELKRNFVNLTVKPNPARKTQSDLQL